MYIRSVRFWYLQETFSKLTKLFPWIILPQLLSFYFLSLEFFCLWNIHGTHTYIDQGQLLHYKAQCLHMYGCNVLKNDKSMGHNQHLGRVNPERLKFDKFKSKPMLGL